MLRRILRRVLGRPPRQPAPGPSSTSVATPPPSSDAPNTANRAHGLSEEAHEAESTTLSVHELVLYKFDSCPYCRRVQRVIVDLGLPVEQRDTRLDRAHREALYRQTGRTQVPCLFIDGQPMFESADIIAWLQDYSLRRNAAQS